MVSITETYTPAIVEEIAEYLMSRTKICPKVGLVVARTMGLIMDRLDSVETIEYQDIPHFPKQDDDCNFYRAKFVFGCLDGFPIMAIQRRFNYFEGYSLDTYTMPIRVMKYIGITHLIVTNTGRSLNSDFEIGDIMILRDHINFMSFAGNSPLRGICEKNFGSPYVAMTNCYDYCLIAAAKKHAAKIDIEDRVHEGVYATVAGPNRETIAELKLLCTVGADSVGFSAAPEVTVARQCGFIVFGFALITSVASYDYEVTEPEISEKDLVRIASKYNEICVRFLKGVVKEICE